MSCKFDMLKVLLEEKLQSRVEVISSSSPADFQARFPESRYSLLRLFNMWKPPKGQLWLR